MTVFRFLDRTNRYTVLDFRGRFFFHPIIKPTVIAVTGITAKSPQYCCIGRVHSLGVKGLVLAEGGRMTRKIPAPPKGNLPIFSCNPP